MTDRLFQIFCSRWLRQYRINYKFHVSVRLLTIKISQWTREDFCSYCKKYFPALFSLTQNREKMHSNPRIGTTYFVPTAWNNEKWLLTDIPFSDDDLAVVDLLKPLRSLISTLHRSVTSYNVTSYNLLTWFIKRDSWLENSNLRWALSCWALSCFSSYCLLNKIKHNIALTKKGNIINETSAERW